MPSRGGSRGDTFDRTQCSRYLSQESSKGTITPTDTDTTFTYDFADRLKTMVDGGGTTTWNYNAASEVTSIGSPTGLVHYTYEDSGRRATMRPNWLATGYGYDYDAAGRLETLTTPWGETVSFLYDTLGRESRRTFTGGHYEERAYDDRDRLTSVVLKSSAGAVLRSQGYTYQANSNVLTHTLGSVTTTYGYDGADQLTSETDTNGYSASYEYDGNGNRSSRTVNGVTETYVYDAGDKLTSVTWPGGSKTYTYDGAGNTKTITSGSGVTTLSYDEEGRLTGIQYPSLSTNVFTYNGFRARRTKTDSTGTRNYVRDGQGAASEIVSDGQAFHFTGGLGDHRGTSTFWHHGGLKNVDGRTDTAGGLLATKSYDAFGNQKGSWGWMPSAEKYGGKFGYQTDPDSGLMMLGHRYYDPNLGRFLSRDPIKSGANWFLYCNNAPIISSDPTGLLDWKRYGHDVGQVILGYSDLIDPVQKGIGIVSLVQSVQTHGIGPTAQAVAEGTLSSYTDFYTQIENPDDPRKFGRSVGTWLSTVVAAGAAAKAGRINYIDPNTVRYSQGSISSTFRNGGSVDALAEGLASGTIHPSIVRAVRVADVHGKLYSLDNRRLYAFRKANKEMPYRMATKREVGRAIGQGKFGDLIDDGLNVRVRGPRQ